MLIEGPLPRYRRDEIRARRPPRNAVDLSVPHGFFIEAERSAAGLVEDVATILLTGGECPFTCLMCDLWRNTTTAATPIGAIPAQIEYAFARLPAVEHVKLYNSGNFFDRKAVPIADWPSIIGHLRGKRTVIIENHPRLCGPACVRFRDLLMETDSSAQLEIALGLETVHREALAALNKQMTVADFDVAAADLVENGIAVRAFVLLKPPFLGDTDAVVWAMRSVERAFASGASVCSIIPVRGGNGVMEDLAQRGLFVAPKLETLERAFAAALALERGRVFVDLWNVERIASCGGCGPPRIERLRNMNLIQRLLPRIDCACGGSAE